MVARVILTKEMIMGLVEGKRLLLRLEVGSSAEQLAERTPSFAEAVKRGGRGGALYPPLEVWRTEARQLGTLYPPLHFLVLGRAVRTSPKIQRARCRRDSQLRYKITQTN